MPGGRPTLITHPLQVRDPITGEARDTTVGERIVELIEQGAYAERAARACGVAKSTFYSWMDQGGQIRLLLGQNPQAKLRVAQARLLEFLDAVEAAEFLYEMTGLQALEAIALGRVTVETVTEKYDATGTLTERIVKSTQQLPNPQVIQWKLTRRFPERYHVVDETVNDTQPDLSSDNVERLVADMEAYVAAMAPAKSPKSTKTRKRPGG